MLKRINIFILVLLLFTSINVIAGDTPEVIMDGKQKALFIGKITAVDNDTYSILPSTVMMGNIQQSEIKVQKFERYYGTDAKPKVGDFIVAVLLDENKIDNGWVFKSTTTDYKTLKLVSLQHDVVTRYEKYINEGKYLEAQKKLDDNVKVTTAPTNTSGQNAEPKEDNSKARSYSSNYIFIAVFAVLITGSIFIVTATFRKRYIN